MVPLTQNALKDIMQGVNIENPVLQYLNHKKLSNSERYRLLVTDGVEVNSFAMLSPQINNYITDNILTEFSIIKVTRFAISMVNNNGQQRRVMVILSLDILVPGNEVGKQIGAEEEGLPAPDPAPAPAPAPAQARAPARNTTPARPPPQLNSSIGETPHVTPIAALTPYQNKWVIKARVTSKSEKRSWSNARGEGTLFSMDLLDESGEIRCTAFKQQCEKFYDMIEVNNVYYITRGTLKPANKQFCVLNNDYEMTLGNDSEIVPCHDDTNTDIPTVKYNFVPIDSIEKKDPKDIVDIIGIIKGIGDVQNLVARNTGRELRKRDVHIIDDSNSMVCLTLWGQQAENFNYENNPIIAVKSVRIGEFQGGKNLSTLQSSVIQIDPDIPEAHKLRGWYSACGDKQTPVNISKTTGAGGAGAPWLDFKDAKDQMYGHPDKPNLYTAKAIINLIKTDNCLYKACPAEGCKKKVVDLDNSMYRCEKCDLQYPNFKYRLLASMSLSDWSGHQWVTAFNDEAEIVFGMSAQELGEMKDSNQSLFLEKVNESFLSSFIFKLRVKLENFSDELRLKTTVVGISRINYKIYNSELIKKIRELAEIGKA